MRPFIQSYHNIQEVNYAIRYNSSTGQDLFTLYKSIVRLNALSPFYKIDDTKEEQAFLIGLKDSAMDLNNSIESLYDNNIFSHKKVIWDTPDILSAYLKDQEDHEFQQEFQVVVEQLASSQINMSLEKDSSLPCPIEGVFYMSLEHHDIIHDFEIHIPRKITNGILMESIQSLLNNSNMGIHATIIESEDPKFKKLRLESEHSGSNGHLFKIYDDIYSNKSLGPVEYLHLDTIIQHPTNSVVKINGEPKEFTSNQFPLNDNMEVDIHSISHQPVNINMAPDYDMIETSISNIISKYNDLISLAQTNKESKRKCTRLLHDLSSTFLGYEDEFLSCGISIENHHMMIHPSLFSEAAKDGGLISLFTRENNYFTNLKNTLTNVYINPFHYINRTIVTYPNTLKPSYINPYITSVYSGMFINYFC